jgi:hypothetical protein
MNGIDWPLLEFASKLLERNERETVLGDLLETNESAWQGLLDVFGLVLRRQAALWRDPGRGSRDSVWHCQAVFFSWEFPSR